MNPSPRLPFPGPDRLEGRCCARLADRRRRGLPPSAPWWEGELSGATSRLVRLVGILLLGHLAVHPRPAVGREVDEQIHHVAERVWLTAYDPTLISNRSFTELSYEDLAEGANLWKVEQSVRLAVPFKEGLAFGAQVLLPLSQSQTDVSSAEGLGDLESRIGLVGRAAADLRWGLALNTKFDTATAPSLGNGAFELRPILAFRWDVSDRLNLGANGEYSFTPQDEGAANVSAFEVKLPLVIKLADTWSGFISYKPKWNFESGGTRHRLECGTTCSWGQNRQYATSLGAEVPLASEALDLKLKLGLQWYF